MKQTQTSEWVTLPFWSTITDKIVVVGVVPTFKVFVEAKK